MLKNPAGIQARWKITTALKSQATGLQPALNRIKLKTI